MKFIKDCLKYSSSIILIMISIALKEFIFKMNIAHAISKKTGIMDALILAVLYFLISFALKKKQKTIIFVIDILISLVLFANVIFYRVYGDFITYGILMEIKQVKSVEGSVLSLIYLKDILYFIDLPFLYYFIFKRKNNEEIKLIHKIFCFAVSVIMCIIFLKFLSVRNPFLTTTEISRSDLFNGYGLVGMYVFDTTNYIENNTVSEPISEKEEKNIKDSIKISSSQESSCKGKNLIIIQVESLQEFVINKTYNNREITPNLNKLIKKSSYYNDCYYQIGLGHTSDAELLSNAALYPLNASSAFMTKYNNSYITLAEVMKKQGYITLSFHGNDGNFWNRNLMFNKFGFDNFYDISKLRNDETIQLGLSDKSLFKQCENILNKSVQPFYAFLITTTSHSPYDIKSDFCETDTNMKKYYNAMNYVDKQLGMFLDLLKKDKILDNSIVMIYGDHNGITYDMKTEFYKEVNEKSDQSYSWEKYQKVPLIIRYPYGSNRGTYSKSVGQIDILPTVLDIYGIGDVKHLGNSILRKEDNLVVLRNGSYIYGNEFYYSLGRVTYDMSKNVKINNDAALIKLAQNQLKASDDIFKYDYYSK